MPKLIPQVKDLEPNPSWVPTKEEQERGLIIHPRVDALLEARSPYEAGIKRALLLYSGKNLDMLDNRKERVVAPFARIFVESKTAEEVRAMKSYEYMPGPDTSDGWKCEFIKDVDEHVKRRVKMRPKKIQALRMKNIAGVSIMRVGYRKVMRVIKDRKPGDEDGELKEWVLREVPVYDDLFVDLVSPLNFAVDPNATTMDDAMDCVHFHGENWEVFYEMYATNTQFKNCEHVRPGHHGRFQDGRYEGGTFRGQKAEGNMVLVCEYFNKIRDEWVVYANGVEIYCGPLPDDHKELSFVSYHNNSNFALGVVSDTVARTSTGDEASPRTEVRAEETFWTEGDPVTIMDLIDLRTGFGRSAYRAMKKAGEYIIATQGNAMFDESRPWRAGDQAVGMMGKYQVDSLGEVNVSGFEFVFNDLMTLMILAIGADPRNLAENKTKTATEAAIQRETSMGRLEGGIEYNEENGEVRLGTLIFKLIQQRYSKPELVKLTGLEDEDELDSFNEVENDENGKPFVGKRLRTIYTKKKYKEERGRQRKDGSYKYYLTATEEGANAFLSRPEYIRSSDIHVTIASGKRAGEIRAIQIEQAQKMLEMTVQLYQLALPPGPGIEALISKDDLPSVRVAVEDYLRALGRDPAKSMGQTPGQEVPEEEKEQKQAHEQYMQSRQPLNPPPMMAATVSTEE